MKITTGSTHRTADEIRNWIVARLQETLHVERGEIRLDEPLIALGVDSMQFVALVGEMEDWLGCRFRDNPLVNYPTIDGLSEFLAKQLDQGKTIIDPAHEPEVSATDD